MALHHWLLASLVLVAPPHGAAPAPLPPAESAPTLAAPEIIIVHGASLPDRRVISDWRENQKLLLSIGKPPRAPHVRPGLHAPFVPPRDRPALQLALFWGSEWRSIAEKPALLRTLRSAQATQEGAFYPATGDSPALMAVGTSHGVLSDSGLAVLARHGVPTRAQ